MDTTTNDLPSNSALLNQTNNLNEQLLEAIRRGDATAITTLLADPDILINQVDTNGWTALMWTASRCHTATVTALLAIPCIEVNHANNKGETALMWAARCGHTATVAELLTAPGILVNQANNNGETALMLASFNNHLTTVAKLLTAPRILVNQADNNGMTALMLATSWKDTATFAALLAVPDILVNLANNKGETPLMLATRYGHMNIVSALIIKGVDFLAVNNNGKTALMLATAKYCRDSSYNKIVTTLRDASLAQLRQRWGNMSDVLNMMPSVEHHEGRPTLTRVASGRHLLLGGDNMDLALAHAIEDRFVQAGDKLSPARFGELAASCRAAKERLFSTAAVEANVTLLGQGSKLVGGSRTATLPRALAEEIVSAGFFPVVARGEAPRGPTTALRGLGLPYERDPAVTRHVAAFLARHASEGHVRAIFLNGGVFRADRLRRALTVGLAACFETEPVLLPNPDPDLAVARGAAIYARLLARGDGAKIRGGSARSYFVGVGDGGGGVAKAVCVVPRFAEESATFETTTPFLLTLGTRARFSLFACDVDKSEAGTVVALDDALQFGAEHDLARQAAGGFVLRSGHLQHGQFVRLGRWQARSPFRRHQHMAGGAAEHAAAVGRDALNASRLRGAHQAAARPPGHGEANAVGAVEEDGDFGHVRRATPQTS